MRNKLLIFLLLVITGACGSVDVEPGIDETDGYIEPVLVRFWVDSKHESTTVEHTGLESCNREALFGGCSPISTNIDAGPWENNVEVAADSVRMTLSCSSETPAAVEARILVLGEEIARLDVPSWDCAHVLTLDAAVPRN